MSNKRNTRAGTSRVETLTALPTVLVLSGLDLAIKLHGSPFFLIYLRSTS